MGGLYDRMLAGAPLMPDALEAFKRYLSVRKARA